MKLNFEKQIEDLANDYADGDPIKLEAFMAGVRQTNGIEGYAIQQFSEFVSEGFGKNESGKHELDRLSAASGLAVEANEVLDLARGNMFYHKTYDKIKHILEIGDTLWFFMATLIADGISLKNVIVANMIKLHERYPNGQREDLVFKDQMVEYKKAKETLNKN